MHGSILPLSIIGLPSAARLLCSALPNSAKFPGHALHEKNLQGQQGVCTLVRSHVRRTAVVPRISRLSTVCQLQVNRTFYSSSGFCENSFGRASGGTFSRIVYDAPEGKRNGCFLGKPTRRPPVLPRTAPPLRRAPPRPDPPVLCPGFGFDKLSGMSCSLFGLVFTSASNAYNMNAMTFFENLHYMFLVAKNIVQQCVINELCRHNVLCWFKHSTTKRQSLVVGSTTIRTNRFHICFRDCGTK